MGHWAKIEDNRVVQVVVADDDKGDWLAEALGGTWIQTSYNTRGGVHYTDGEPSADQSKALRGNYAGVGFTYDADRDAFIPPKPFDSWVLDEATCLWTAPIPYPADGGQYVWDEATTDWLEVVDEVL
ncbi:hypothetical protein phiPsal1_024 [Pontimonas phage phiPsal1]|nr:hypothetical protein phiPsal1_024 [Pontimonas phage phiPsal1]